MNNVIKSAVVLTDKGNSWSRSSVKVAGSKITNLGVRYQAGKYKDEFWIKAEHLEELRSANLDLDIVDFPHSEEPSGKAYIGGGLLKTDKETDTFRALSNAGYILTFK